MSKANQFFTQRGEVTKTIEYKGKTIDITLNIPTNFEHDSTMEEFTEETEFGTSIRASEMIEARLVRNIIKLSFDIPKTEDVNGEYINWSDATPEEKQCAIRSMDHKLRELINTEIICGSTISEDEQGKLE